MKLQAAINGGIWLHAGSCGGNKKVGAATD
jgi:hypothetical protein